MSPPKNSFTPARGAASLPSQPWSGGGDAVGEGDSAPDPISFFACVSGDRDRREKARPAGGGGKEREEIIC